jgi:hypothetical protein
LAPPAGASHDRSVAFGFRHGELGGDGECGGRGSLAGRTRSTTWTARHRGIRHSAADARGNDGRGTGYLPGRRSATGALAFRICGTGFGCGAYRRHGHTTLDASASSASQAGRRGNWRCHHRAPVRNWLGSASGVRGYVSGANITSRITAQLGCSHAASTRRGRRRCWRRVLTAYPVDFGGLWWSNRPPVMAALNSKTTLVDYGGPPTLCMAFRRSGVRIPSGPPNFRVQNGLLAAKLAVPSMEPAGHGSARAISNQPETGSESP